MILATNKSTVITRIAIVKRAVIRSGSQFLARLADRAHSTHWPVSISVVKVALEREVFQDKPEEQNDEQ